ncbi:MAG: Aldose 1-epimerase [Frankiales bacterium]|nr:Aldose 1-epimerase [Frankiales bacterium]
MAQQDEPLVISAGDYRAEISPIGAALAGCWHAGRPVTVARGDGPLPLMSNGATLLPWPNRIRDGRYSFDGHDYQLALTEPAKLNASHGLVRWVRWSVLDQTGDTVLLSHRLVPQTGYPFTLNMVVGYQVVADAGLRVSVSVTNSGAGPVPFGAGSHPYLSLRGTPSAEAELTLPASARLLVDDRQLPIGRALVADTPYDFRSGALIGELALDDGYADLIGDSARLRFADTLTELWWDENYRYLQVFTPPVARFGQAAVAIEPMSCPADAFRSGEGLITLAAGDKWTGRWGVRTGPA